jgi:hypothetical protein
VRTTYVTCPEHENCVASLSLKEREPGDRGTLRGPEWAKEWLIAQKHSGLRINHIEHIPARGSVDEGLLVDASYIPPGQKSLLVRIDKRQERLEQILTERVVEAGVATNKTQGMIAAVILVLQRQDELLADLERRARPYRRFFWQWYRPRRP